MFFNKQFSLPTDEGLNSIKPKIVGKTIDVKNARFIILDNGSTVNIYPYADPKEIYRALPLGEIGAKKAGSLTLKMWPRTTDVGIPMLIILFSMFAILCAIVSLFLFKKNWIIPLNIFAYAVLAQILLWLIMQFGYYSYVRNIKKQVFDMIR